MPIAAATRRLVALALPLLAIGCAAGAPKVVPPAAPKIATRTFTVEAAGDGTTDATSAIQQAIDRCAQAGGGSVEVPAGRYLIRPIELKSGVELHLAKDATLLGSTDFATYPKGPSRYFDDEVRFTDLIRADFCHDVAITGEGTIDGQGQAWWREHYKHPRKPGTPAWINGTPEFPHRPNLVVLSGCIRVRVEGVTLVNSPMFHLIPQQCQDVTIDRVTIRAPAGAPNTDGIDPSGRRIRITNCDIATGDDNVVFKPQYPPTFPRPWDAKDHAACEDLYVADCTFGRGHGLSIGGQTTDGLRRLLVERCTFDGTKVGIRLKAQQGTGGPVEDCLYRDLKMTNVGTAVLVTSYYPGIPADPATMPAVKRDAKTPTYRNLTFERLTATGSTEAGALIGLAERPIEGVTFRDVSIDAKRPMRIVDARRVRFERSTVTSGVVATRSGVDGIQPGAWTGAVAPIGKDGAPPTTAP